MNTNVTYRILIAERQITELFSLENKPKNIEDKK